MAAEHISYCRQAATAEGSTHLSLPEDGREPSSILPANQKDHSICRLCRCSSRSSCRISLHKRTTQMIVRSTPTPLALNQKVDYAQRYWSARHPEHDALEQVLNPSTGMPPRNEGT